MMYLEKQMLVQTSSKKKHEQHADKAKNQHRIPECDPGNGADFFFSPTSAPRSRLIPAKRSRPVRGDISRWPSPSRTLSACKAPIWQHHMTDMWQREYIWTHCVIGNIKDGSLKANRHWYFRAPKIDALHSPSAFTYIVETWRTTNLCRWQPIEKSGSD